MTEKGFKIKNFSDCTEKEMEEVLSWRNDPEVRRNSFSPEPISRESHFEYVKSLPGRKDRVYFLASDGSGPAGVFSFTNINEISAEVGYYKAPGKNGEKGVGTALLKLAEKTAGIIGGGRWRFLITEVFSSNIPSIKSIERAGYTEAAGKRRAFLRNGEKLTVLRYELPLKEEP